MDGGMDGWIDRLIDRKKEKLFLTAVRQLINIK